MASISTYTRSGGSKTYTVRFRPGGGRTTKAEQETFDVKRDATDFKRDVELADNNWPAGWIKGVGFRQVVEADAVKTSTTFGDYASTYVADLTAIQGDTRQRYRRQVLALIPELNKIINEDPTCLDDVATVENITDKHIKRWVNHREHNLGNNRKTVANYHGLLFSIFEAAIEEGLIPRNPCKKTKIGRANTGRAVKDDEDDTDMVLLEPDEFALFVSCIPEGDRDFIRAAVGTGERWGELTATKVRDLYLDGPVPRLSVRRAWKRIGDDGAPKGAALHNNGRFYLGRPKSKAGVRNITLDSETVKVFRRAIDGKGPNDFVFTAPKGGALDHGHFYERVWGKSVATAQAKGLAKRPTFHDLRHTHVGWLLSATPAVPLTVVKRRLGHESITTTVDTYGHLVHEAHEAVAAAVRNALLGRKLVVVKDADYEDAEVTFDADDVLPDEMSA